MVNIDFLSIAIRSNEQGEIISNIFIFVEHELSEVWQQLGIFFRVITIEVCRPHEITHHRLGLNV